MGYETILYETKGAVAVITINRPEALNALNPQVLTELDQVVSAAGEDPGVKVVVITGAGKAFVAGADIKAMSTFTPLQARAFARRGQAVLNKIERLPKPVIAAVNGFALGGGCELAMACDFIIASRKARFGQPEINLGITPGFAGTQRLPRLVGKGWAKYLCLTGEMISAEKAQAIGLVVKVVEPDELMEEVMKVAEAIAAKGRMSLRAVKQLIDEGADMAIERAMALEAEVFATCFASPDQKEGMSAFLEKRKPNFTGELDK